jgi:phosphoribosylaminoimidazole-succinocarboxamide synthase
MTGSNVFSSDLDKIIKQQLPVVFTEAHYDFLGVKISGKVRDSYVLDALRVLVTSDRLSCFDRVITSIPFKGQVLNALALYWFQKTSDIIHNHVVAVPEREVLIARNCKILPVEVVVRGYLAGSAWRDYEAGRAVSGVVLPQGMKAFEKLPAPIVTPSTKAAMGDHDEPISEADIVSRGIVEASLWNKVRTIALQLFDRGTAMVAERGLLLVDTKYEFGIVLEGEYEGELILADEIHTLDSSRYWMADSYEARLSAGEVPEMLDKEPIRRWLMERGFMGDGEIPEFSDEYRGELSHHYISSYEKITGEHFVPKGGSRYKVVEQALRDYFEI